MKIKTTLIIIQILFLAACSGGSDSSSGGGSAAPTPTPTPPPPPPPPNTYAGTWSGTICNGSRGLTVSLSQSGNSLSGNYTLTNPGFSEGLNGSVANLAPPSTAVLTGGVDRSFRITFNSFNSFSGGFYKGATQVCNATATKP